MLWNLAVIDYFDVALFPMVIMNITNRAIRCWLILRLKLAALAGLILLKHGHHVHSAKTD